MNALQTYTSYHQFLESLYMLKLEKLYTMFNYYNLDPFFEWFDEIAISEPRSLFKEVLFMQYATQELVKRCGVNVLSEIMYTWISKYSDHINIHATYKNCRGEVVYIVIDTPESLESKIKTPLTLLNVVCYTGDYKLLNLLYKLYGSETINLIN